MNTELDATLPPLPGSSALRVASARRTVRESFVIPAIGPRDAQCSVYRLTDRAGRTLIEALLEPTAEGRSALRLRTKGSIAVRVGVLPSDSPVHVEVSDDGAGQLHVRVNGVSKLSMRVAPARRTSGVFPMNPNTVTAHSA